MPATSSWVLAVLLKHAGKANLFRPVLNIKHVKIIPTTSIMLVGIAIPLKADVVRLACVFVCYICYPTVEKGPNSNLSSLILLHLRIPLNRNEIFQRVKKLTDQRMVTKTRTGWIFTILSLKPSEVQASSWKNIFNSNPKTQIDESWSTKLPP